MNTFTEVDFKELYENEETRVLLYSWFEKYEKARIAKLEMKAVYDAAREEGFIKGKIEGKAEGKKESEIEIVKLMKLDRYSLEIISKCTIL